MQARGGNIEPGQPGLICRSGVMLKYPSPAVTEPMQISDPLLQLLELNEGKEKVVGVEDKAQAE